MVERTWSATIEVRTGHHVETVDASESEHDLLRDQIQVALGEAAEYAEDHSEVCVTVHKTTAARGKQRDRSFMVYRDRRGQIRAN